MLSKRLSGLVTLGLLASASAHAEGPKVGLDLRFDNEQSSVETKYKSDAADGSHKAGDKTTAKDGKFYTTRVRLKVTGDLTPKTSYNFILSPVSDVKTGGEAKTVDGAPKAVKYASIRHKFSDMFALEIGKLGINLLSIENDYSGYDWIFGSRMNDVVYGAYADHDTHGFVEEGSETGAQGDLTFGDHVISIQVLNGLKGDRAGKDASGAAVSQSHSTGALSTTFKYQGKLAGGLLEPLATYAVLQHADRELGNNVDGKEATWGKKDQISVYGIGTKINVAGLGIDIEHQGFDQAESKRKSDDAIVVQKFTSQGQVLKIQYNLPSPKISPFVKVTTETSEYGKGSEKLKMEDMRWGLGVFFWPEENSTIRFHAGYWQDAMKTKQGGQKIADTNGSTFNCGAGLKF